jgi:nucleoside-diphosphate-sugar epimerase
LDLKIHLLAIGEVQAERPFGELDEQRGAIGEDADHAIMGGEDRLGDFLRKRLLFRRHNYAFESHDGKFMPKPGDCNPRVFLPTIPGMKVLIIGGTGLISLGIVKHLLERGATITQFNRSQRDNPYAKQVRTLVGDRNDASFAEAFKSETFDVVIDMIGFSPQQGEADVRVFGGRCAQFIFCSTVCTYGIKIPPQVLVDENFPQEPISEYGKNKVICEKTLLAAGEVKKFAVTIIRPSSTYGPEHSMIDNLEPDPVSWDRIERDQPVLCAGDGLGLWQSTHRDDVGRLFAYACLNPKTFGQSYNATRRSIVTWRDYYRETAAALGKSAALLFMPAEWIVAHDPARFGLLREITQYHGAYTSAKAERDVPEFGKGFVDLRTGAGELFTSRKKSGLWKEGKNDVVYQKMVEKALSAGIKPVNSVK